MQGELILKNELNTNLKFMETCKTVGIDNIEMERIEN
jgi:hypothetical protein